MQIRLRIIITTTQIINSLRKEVKNEDLGFVSQFGLGCFKSSVIESLLGSLALERLQLIENVCNDFLQSGLPVFFEVPQLRNHIAPARVVFLDFLQGCSNGVIDFFSPFFFEVY